jgi:3-oxoacyl-(acyl-carrier-protein) synthase
MTDSRRRVAITGIGMVTPAGNDVATTWEALLVAILPGRFDPNQAKNMADVISLLRRAGYPYDTPGDFYAAAIRDFSVFLAVGGLLAGALAGMQMKVTMLDTWACDACWEAFSKALNHQAQAAAASRKES